MTAFLEREIETYQDHFDEIRCHDGQFVLIKGTDIVDYFDSYRDALKEGYGKFYGSDFMVKQVSSEERIHTFTRDISSSCPA